MSDSVPFLHTFVSGWVTLDRVTGYYPQDPPATRDVVLTSWDRMISDCE